MWKPPALGSLRLQHLERLPDRGASLELMKFHRCSDLHYVDDVDASVELTICGDGAEALTLRLCGVTSLKLPETSPHFWLAELEIVDIRERGLEGIRFVMQSENGDGLLAYCYDIECLRYTPSVAKLTIV